MANPNPSPETRFQPGISPNPGGKTSEQKRREMRNAEMATQMRERMLEAEIAKMMADPEYVPDLDANLLKLIKDSEDRGLGAPTAKTAFTDGEGNDVPTSLTLNIVRAPGS